MAHIHEHEIIEAPINGVVAQEAISTNPLDMNPEQFKAGLARRKENRKALMGWVGKALVEDVDFGSITIKGHKSRPSLMKPGAEKICGMLGLTPTFPTLRDYEQIILEGKPIKLIVIRCEMMSGAGQKIAEGVGARDVTKDYGDLNKALKMALKSAQIDATLRCAGLSEIFTQDIEDMGLADKNQAVEDEIRVNGGSRAKAKPKPKPDPMSDAQLKKIWAEANMYWGKDEADGELHLAVQKKYGVTSVKNLSKSQASEIIEGLSASNKKKPDVAAAVSNTRELIDITVSMLGLGKTNAVTHLNHRAKSLLGKNTIDDINADEIARIFADVERTAKQ